MFPFWHIIFWQALWEPTHCNIFPRKYVFLRKENSTNKKQTLTHRQTPSCCCNNVVIVFSIAESRMFLSSSSVFFFAVLLYFSHFYFCLQKLFINIHTPCVQKNEKKNRRKATVTKWNENGKWGKLLLSLFFTILQKVFFSAMLRRFCTVIRKCFIFAVNEIMQI
jgi:hypothetical protein